MITAIKLVGRSLIGGILALASPAAAQDAPSPFPEIYNQMLNAHTLVEGGDGVAVWAPDNKGLWYAVGGKVRLVDPASGATIVSLDEERLRAQLAKVFGNSAISSPLPLQTMVPAGPGKLSFTLGGTPANLDLVSYEIALPPGAKPVLAGQYIRSAFGIAGRAAPDILSPDGETVATVDPDGNIATRAVRDPSFQVITEDATERFGWDLEGPRISLGSLRAVQTTPWSGDSSKLFAMKVDRQGQPTLPTYRPMQDPLPDVQYRDLFVPGGTFYRPYPAIIDVASKKTIPVKMNFGSDIIVFLSWSDDNRSVYFAHVNRLGSVLNLIKADAATGAAEIVLQETDPRGGLRNPHALYYAGNIGFAVVPGNRGFLWLSEKDGWNHLYHYDTSGRLIRRLTKGEWRVDNIVEVDRESGQIYFTGRPDKTHVYDVHVMSIPLAGGKPQRLSEGRGVHDAPLISPDGKYLVDRFESFQTPPRVEIRTTDGRLASVVDEADASALMASGWKPPLEFTTTINGNEDIRGVMYRPFNFDPSKRYPIVEYIYGGPQTVWSYPSFLSLGEAVGTNIPLALAQLGYIVLKFDTPGSPGRSRAFQMAVADKWGAGVIGDHAAVIRSLAKQYSWLDETRVGIFGHSWGGYHALFALATEGDLYDAAVASAPGFGIPAVRDSLMEGYLGTPKDNPEAWDRADILGKVENINNPLMLVVGTQDTMYYLVSLRVSDALIKRGVQHEIALAPGQGHGLYGLYADYLTEKEVRFFLRTVPPGPGMP